MIRQNLLPLMMLLRFATIFSDLYQVPMIMLFLGCTGAVCIAMLMTQIALIQVTTYNRTKFPTCLQANLFHSFSISFQQASRSDSAISVGILGLLGAEFGIRCLRIWSAI